MKITGISKMASMFPIILVVVAAILSIAPEMAVGQRGYNGIVTANTAADTVIARTDFLPRSGAGVSIWSPDAECRVRLVYTDQGIKYRPNFLFAASNQMQLISLANVDSVYLDKSAIQRVGVFFLGN